MSSSPIRLPYSDALFVKEPREQAIEKIQDVFTNIKKPDTPRTVILRGERGSGKSWLVYHLKRTVLPKNDKIGSILLISFSPLPPGHLPQPDELFLNERDLVKSDPEDVTRQILEWIAKQIGLVIDPNESLLALGRQVVETIQRKFQDRVLVIMLDSIFEMEWKLLEKLEPYVLAPLRAVPTTLLIMTGRGRIYRFVSPSLRLEAEYLGEKELKAFEEGEIQEQLRLQVPASNLSPQRIRDIKELGGGFPLANLLLAQNEDEGTALVIAADALLEVVSPRLETRARVFKLLTALCVLSGFREDEIKYMFAEYENDASIEALNEYRVGAWRDELLETNFVFWQKAKARFQIDDPVRRILENNLRVNNRKRWIRLHCRAYHMYEEWAMIYPLGNDYYRKRMQEHQSVLIEKAEKNPEDCRTTTKHREQDQVESELATPYFS